MKIVPFQVHEIYMPGNVREAIVSVSVLDTTTTWDHEETVSIDSNGKMDLPDSWRPFNADNDFMIGTIKIVPTQTTTGETVSKFTVRFSLCYYL